MPREPLKHLYFDLTQVAYRDGQEAEHELKMSCDNLKHRLLDLITVEFGAFQGEENDF